MYRSYPHEVKASLSRPIIFKPSPKPTLGVECELSLVDSKTGALVPKGPEILSILSPENIAKQELFQCIVEVVTGVCADIEAVRADLGAKMRRVKEVCAQYGVTTLSSGTHPYATWEDQPITENERYMRLVERMGQPARQMLIMGTHVHVGVDSAEKAIAVMNGISYYLPHLLALSASSPYSNAGKDSSMASWRLKVFEALPTAGLSPQINNWTEQVRLMRTLINAGAIESIREIWWDVRPHPGFGTIEIRVCDAISTPTEVLLITALVQSLVVYLGDLYDEGTQLIFPNWSLKENKWRAARYGIDRGPAGNDMCQIICDERGTTIGVRDDLMNTIEKLMSVAERLGTAKYLQAIPRLFDLGASYQRQRACFAKSHKHEAVALKLIDEFNNDTIADAVGLPNFWA